MRPHPLTARSKVPVPVDGRRSLLETSAFQVESGWDDVEHRLEMLSIEVLD